MEIQMISTSKLKHICKFLNPICLNILRLKAKTKPQVRRKRQGVPSQQLFEAIRVNVEKDLLNLTLFLTLGKSSPKRTENPK